MKSVGEVMAMGRTFQESMQKALRGLEVGSAGLEPRLEVTAEDARDVLIGELSHPGPDRLWYVADAFRAGMTVDEVVEHSSIDPWFLVQLEDLVRCAEQLRSGGRRGGRA